ncbi:hypothetical protein FHY71_26605 [Bacillus tropicus]|uniref:Uncharacterized protein n=1 Tax=Bacillus tropicus TaxID=2026188 RepID=A0A5C4ZXQ5_9BACI|nr:hypothetical protein FHY71_26605 [Bacillus tropicus]
MNPYFQKEFAFFFFYNPIHLFIHSCPGVGSGLLFVTGLAKKLYKISHTLSLVNMHFHNSTP